MFDCPGYEDYNSQLRQKTLLQPNRYSNSGKNYNINNTRSVHNVSVSTPASPDPNNNKNKKNKVISSIKDKGLIRAAREMGKNERIQ